MKPIVSIAMYTDAMIVTGRGRIVIFTHEDGRRHADLLQIVAQIRLAQHDATGGIGIQVIPQEDLSGRLRQFRMCFSKLITEPAR